MRIILPTNNGCSFGRERVAVSSLSPPSSGPTDSEPAGPLLNAYRPRLPDGVRGVQRAHLIGIAGAGMRSLCEILLSWGWELSGSDLVTSPARSLAARGVRVRQGHSAGHLPPGTDLVIHSDAIPPENPELRQAARRGIPTVTYFQMLGRLISDRHGLAVAGTHGKSTTTAMAADLLVGAGLDPTVVFGATRLGRSSGGRAGRGELMLVEACEYRANFLHLNPRQAVILGIEPDHFDCYGSLEQLERAFGRFAGSVPEDGLLLIRQGCQSTERAAAGARCRVETFGFSPRADWSAHDLNDRRGRYGFGVFRHGRPLGGVRLRVPGKHNVLNALAAAALAWHNGVSPEQIAWGLGRFGGLARRLEVLGSWRGVLLVDDYAHHPTEVIAALGTVRRMYPGRRVWCVFQPHQASRTKHLLDELAASLNNADKVVVCEIFRAREPGPAGGEVTAADLAEQIRALRGDVADVHADAGILALLEGSLQPGDVLITMGAGDIRKICDGLFGRLRKDRAAG